MNKKAAKWHEVKLDAQDENYRALITSISPQGYARVGRDLLHRRIAQPSKGECVDHINGDKLDNRRSNLRLCDESQNAANRHAVLSKSGLKGVCWEKQTRKWRATITVHYKQISLGRYHKLDDAKQAYNKASVKYFGKFANTGYTNE